ncbi:hypothetical protein CHU92_06485 [Flavobacterium cyanobacteriorum]|uniref:Uncharacterized protein n=1 Tax=Flavobacterium cyanobacteriorum TaxID=2022802 RepID=A0A255ZC03_9FLAO|nr:hypothetical protein CHU92_06485 [Flavobacterium cyanobacteriorum]
MKLTIDTILKTIRKIPELPPNIISQSFAKKNLKQKFMKLNYRKSKSKAVGEYIEDETHY